MKKKTQTTKQKQKTKCKKSLSWNEQFTVKKKKYKKKNLKSSPENHGRHCICKNISLRSRSSMLPKYNLTQETESHTQIKIE